MINLAEQEQWSHENKIYPQVEMKKAQFVTVQSISPQQLFLAREEEAKVRIVGGKSPYKVTVTAGAAQSTGNEIDYTAPNVAGTYTMTVSESAGKQAFADITVALDLLITPVSPRVSQRETQTFRAVGGFGKKPWIATNGEFTKSQSNKTEADSVEWEPDELGTTFMSLK